MRLDPKSHGKMSRVHQGSSSKPHMKLGQCCHVGITPACQYEVREGHVGRPALTNAMWCRPNQNVGRKFPHQKHTYTMHEKSE